MTVPTPDKDDELPEEYAIAIAKLFGLDTEIYRVVGVEIQTIEKPEPVDWDKEVNELWDEWLREE